MGKRTERSIPESIWEYFIEAPNDWEGDDVDEKGIHNGVRNVLLAQRSIKPWWVQHSSLKMMSELQLKFTRVVQALEEMDRFTRQKMPEDNQLNAECKSAQRQADNLHVKLQDACNALSSTLVTPDESFGYEFYDYIFEFLDEAKENNKARDKVEEMRNRLSTRGVVTHQTNISSDQVKSQLPTFSGESSFSILVAVDTWESILKTQVSIAKFGSTLFLNKSKNRPYP